jgi:hypothetical protein
LRHFIEVMACHPRNGGPGVIDLWDALSGGKGGHGAAICNATVPPPPTLRHLFHAIYRLTAWGKAGKVVPEPHHRARLCHPCYGRQASALPGAAVRV